MTRIIVTNEEGDTKEITKDNYFIFDNYFNIAHKVEWDENDVHYVCEKTYQMYPIFSSQKMVILYRSDSPEFKRPDNLIIHNPDKSVYKTVTVPPFINETVLKTKINPFNHPEGFSYLKELINIEGKEYLVIGINTYAYMGSRMGHCTMIEERALDIETGLFHPTWNKGPLYW